MDEIFAGLAPRYRKETVSRRMSFYFSIDEVKKTVVLDADGCSVADGKTGENVDCVCKTSGEFFRKVWDKGYTPGLRDFMNGTIKSNAPHLLQEFMTAFGK